MSIAWLSYFVFCIIVGFLLLVIIFKNDKIDDLQSSYDYWYKRYRQEFDENCQLRDKIREYDNIFENIKNSLPF